MKKEMNFEEAVMPGLSNIKVPNMARISQNVPDYSLDDVQSRMIDKLEKSSVSTKINKGDQIAIGVGSRGLDKIQVVVKTLINFIQKHGGCPFIVPSMGSHGGATVKGQKEVLNDYGINEEELGVPIKASMEVKKIGTTNNGIDVYFDKISSQADIIIPINRVKVHTNFEAEHESGIMKMLAIGFGNHKGCSYIHGHGFENFSIIIPNVAKTMMSSLPIDISIALLEDGHDNLSQIEVLEKNEVEDKEKEMLKKQKELMPEIPFEKVDILIVEKMGKNISGTGLDTNIISRIKSVDVEIDKIVVLDLTKETHGNATGMGMADIVPKEFLKKINFKATITNSLAAREVSFAKMPVVLKDEMTAIKTAIWLFNKPIEEIKIVHIPNTLNIVNMNISQGLYKEAKENNDIKMSKEFRMEFSNGVLKNKFNY